MLSVLLALLLVPSQSDSSRLTWVPNPRTTYGGWVSDPAGHLRAQSKARIDSIIAALERSTTVEIAVVVADSLDGLDAQTAALLLHRRWGVGKSGRNNGIVFLWSPALRKTHVSIGYGLEGRITDGRAGRIQDEITLPHFRRAAFDEGVVRTVEAIAAISRNETYHVPVGPATSAGGGEWTPNLWLVFAAIVAFVLGGYAVAKSSAPHKLDLWLTALILGRLRAQRCANGHGKMRRVPETAEDAYLSNEELVERRIKSIDFDVWICDQCDHRAVRPYDGDVDHAACPQCNRRTARKESKVRIAPTFSTDGEAEVQTKCANCGYEDVKTEKLSRRSASGSSRSWKSGGFSGGGRSFGGGSSFGGGRSGGGGAGRSY